MVDRPRLERGTNGLKVRCSTNWANDPENRKKSHCDFRFARENLLNEIF